MALAVILASVNPKPIIAHVVHDLRSPDLTTQDQISVQELATCLGCAFVHRSIKIKSLPGNLEHNARSARYDTLAEMAQEHQLSYIATGHHADDQLETMLMNLARGTGPRGLAGIQDSRRLNEVNIIRPLLGITHQSAVDLCQELGINWRHDHTNDDHSLTRNRLRHTVLPVLRDFDADIARRASSASDSCRSTMHALQVLVERSIWTLATIEPALIAWGRSDLREQPSAALVELIRMSIEHLCDGAGMDRVTQGSLGNVIRAITDSSTEPRSCYVGPIVAEVTARTVVIKEKTQESGHES